MAVLVSLAVLAGPARGGQDDVVEMKLRVWLGPDRIEEVADRVLEFYDVGPESFVAAFTRDSYDRMVADGYRVEVLVRDMREEASRWDGFFHTYEQIRDTWATIARDHPGICVLDTLGTSANGNLLLAMKISDNPAVMEREPRICFDFTIHGNENNGTEIAHWALLEILEGYGVDPDITRWVDGREIWLLPMVNPDGLISRSRYNGNGVDCNRNYGYAWDGGGSGAFSESETQVLYHLGVNNPMASWTQYHTGTERAMWAWGYTQLATRDSAIHRYEMERYSQITGYPSCQIARGLYPVNGGSTDWYYGATGAQGYGIEVCNGQPSPPGEIDTINHANWSAMQEMIERVMWGISGTVTDSASGAELEALVSVDPPGWFTFSDSIGYFHKNLHAGTYDVTVSANGYRARTIEGVAVPADTFVFLNVALVRDTTEPLCAFRVITNEISNSNATDAWRALRQRDSVPFTLDRGAWASFDMGRHTPIPDGPGDDFEVVESDGTPDGYTAYASNEWNGPWQSLGTGTGTTGFDLDAAGLESARFIRIVDDNSGNGVSIDAIEASVVYVPMMALEAETVIDSPPGGNGDGLLDPGEDADLVVELLNEGRGSVFGLAGVLRSSDTLVAVLDSTGVFGDIEPDSTGDNDADRFRVRAVPETPLEHEVGMKLVLAGTDYSDSLEFTLVVGTVRATDPVPDGPREPALYWAYDDGDVSYEQAPVYDWVELRGSGTLLPLEDQETKQLVLPPAFGPFYFYGERFDTLSICSNGWLAGGVTTDRSWQNRELPTNRSRVQLCPLWDDLNPEYGGGVLYRHDPDEHRFVIEWDSVHYSWQPAEWDRFQVVLYDTTMAGPDGNSEFVFQYATANNYVSCTVGEQDPTMAIGINCLFDQAYHRASMPLVAGRAIRYTTDPPRVSIVERPGQPGRPDFPGLVVEGNPFSGNTVARYALCRPGRAGVTVHDNSGRRVATLFSGVRDAGTWRANWRGQDDNGRTVAAGVYWVRLVTGGGTATAKLVKLN